MCKLVRYISFNFRHKKLDFKDTPTQVKTKFVEPKIIKHQENNGKKTVIIYSFKYNIE